MRYIWKGTWYAVIVDCNGTDITVALTGNLADAETLREKWSRSSARIHYARVSDKGTSIEEELQAK